jgi:hypothetical protein
MVQIESTAEDTMSKAIMVVSVVALAAALAGGGAAAAPAMVMEPAADHGMVAQTTGDIMVGPYLVARVRVAAAGFTVEERATIIRSRVLEILSDGSLTPDTIAAAVSVRKSGADRVISVGKRLFFTVTTADAQATQATADELAQMWAHNLRLALPKVKPTTMPASEAPG